MSQCGGSQFISGGTLESPKVITPEIIGGTLSSVVVDSATIVNLTSLDEASLLTVMNGLSKLPKEQLQILADAIFKALTITPTTAPTFTDETEVSTNTYGLPTARLGEPNTWIELGGACIPTYTK